MSAKQDIIEFKIERVDRKKVGFIPVEDSLVVKPKALRAANEQTEVLEAYNDGLIILKFDWEYNVSQNGYELFVTLGSVKWKEEP